MSWGNFKAIVLGRKKRSMPDGVAQSCPGCQKTIFSKELVDNYYVCVHCEHHFNMPVGERVRHILDEDSGKELFTGITSDDPLDFKGLKTYQERLNKAKEDTELEEAVVCYSGSIEKTSVILACTDSRFLMGSMGSAVGEKITRAFDEGKKKKCPVIIVSCSGGGARMDEGALSVMQMVKTSSAVYEFQQAGGLYISVLANPTMGGVMASYASLGDLILAEPKALIGFTGRRVIKQTTNEELPEQFQESEFLLEHGQIDRIVHRKELRETLNTLIKYLYRIPAVNRSSRRMKVK